MSLHTPSTRKYYKRLYRNRRVGPSRRKLMADWPLCLQVALRCLTATGLFIGTLWHLMLESRNMLTHSTALSVHLTPQCLHSSSMNAEGFTVLGPVSVSWWCFSSWEWRFIDRCNSLKRNVFGKILEIFLSSVGIYYYYIFFCPSLARDYFAIVECEALLRYEKSSLHGVVAGFLSKRLSSFS